jgi:hypothetical protein
MLNASLMLSQILGEQLRQEVEHWENEGACRCILLEECAAMSELPSKLWSTFMYTL